MMIWMMIRWWMMIRRRWMMIPYIDDDPVHRHDRWLVVSPVLLDLYSRRVVGWAMSDRIDTELALSALRMVSSTRALELGWIHHRPRLPLRQR
jgi:transposase InsO family protein